MSDAFTEDFRQFIRPGVAAWREDPSAHAGFEAGWRACEQRLTPQIHRALEEPTQNESDLDEALTRLRQAVLNYDAGLRRVAARGEPWLVDEDLDRLYEALLQECGQTKEGADGGLGTER